MKKVIGVVIAGIIILGLIGNGGSRTGQEIQKRGNRLSSESSVAAEQNSEGGNGQSPKQQNKEKEKGSEEETEEKINENAKADDSKKQENEESQAQEQTETAASDSSEEGISAEFKEAMDSYEAFINEYADFMKKYHESGNPTEMLMDYSNYLIKYTDTMDKIEKIDYENLTIQEQQYYIEVTARIEKKLLEVSQYTG